MSYIFLLYILRAMPSDIFEWSVGPCDEGFEIETDVANFE